jgi:hypothetical protein
VLDLDDAEQSPARSAATGESAPKQSATGRRARKQADDPEKK